MHFVVLKIHSYFLQVIAREDKGELYGIDYKYSDMITSYGKGTINLQPQTTLPPSQPIRPTQPTRSNSNTQVNYFRHTSSST